jgi:molybdenum cofactor cytidylyltransferase
MGSPKALLEFRGETFIDRLVRVLATVCDPVIVVLGYHAAEIRAQTHGRAQFVVNPDPDRGQLSSLQTALAAIPADAEGVMFVPVDCPAIEPETVAHLAAELANWPVVVPRHEGRRGHPVCVARPIVAELLALAPTNQPRDLLRAHAHYLDVDDAGVLADIDDRAAYERLAQ